MQLRAGRNGIQHLPDVDRLVSRVRDASAIDDVVAAGAAHAVDMYQVSSTSTSSLGRAKNIGRIDSPTGTSAPAMTHSPWTMPVAHCHRPSRR